VSAVEPQRPRTEPPPTCRGYRQDEVVSCLQKAIRRGLEDDALFWAVELDESGWGEYAWSRLVVICSEDVGLADPHMPSTIAALYSNWQLLRKRRRGRSAGRATS
jgi:replication-associated recombination protein RarA